MTIKGQGLKDMSNEEKLTVKDLTRAVNITLDDLTKDDQECLDKVKSILNSDDQE